MIRTGKDEEAQHPLEKAWTLQMAGRRNSERVSTPPSLYAAALMSTASLAVSVLAYRSADTIERCVASVLALPSETLVVWLPVEIVRVSFP